MSDSLYDILEIPSNASADDIRAAYRLHSQRWHPDKNPGDPGASDMMSRLNHAYAILSDPVERMNYDASLLRDQRQRPPNASTDPEATTPGATPTHREAADRISAGAYRFSMVVLLILGVVCVVALVGGLIWLVESDGLASSSTDVHTLREFLESVSNSGRTGN